MKYNALNLILDEDLEKFLKRIEIYNDFINGKIICNFCNQKISIENLQLILPQKDSKFIFVCNNPYCIKKFYENYEDKDD